MVMCSKTVKKAHLDRQKTLKQLIEAGAEVEFK
jgi:hypothetical protein